MHPKRVLIIGIGLIGGSLLKAIRKYFKETKVDAAVRQPQEYWDIKPYIHELIDLKEPLPALDWDLVFVCTPVHLIPQYVRAAAAVALPQAVISDVGSSKAWLDQELADIPNFIGSHPMAGKEKTGFQFSEAELFFGKTTVICPREGGDESLSQRLSFFWESVGSRVISKTAAEHDQIVAYTSHLPHVLSYLYSCLGETSGLDIAGIFGGSFKDFTRIGQSDPQLWQQIFESNKKNIVNLIEKFIKFLYDFKDLIQVEDWQSVKKIIIQSNDFLKNLENL